MKLKQVAIFAAACLIAAPLSAKTIATVNGEDISQDKLDNFVKLLVEQGAEDSDELRAQVKQEMINRLALVQVAEKENIDQQEAVKQELDLARQGILVRALMQDYLENNPVSDEAIQKEYDAIKEARGQEHEYKVRHILLEEEDEAKALLEDINADKVSFEDAAKEKSIDSGSGKKGGELGWAPATNYVPEFAEAVREMEAGTLAAEPVKSQFGWHIIEVEDRREVAMPDLDELKPQLEERLRQQALTDFQNKILEDADIEEK